jgi:hypothetical protein
LLVGYPQPTQKIVSGDQKDSGMVNRETDKQVAGREDATASTRTAASARQQADGSQDDWFANIVDTWDREGVIASPRGRMPEQPVSESGATDTSVQEAVLAASEPDMATQSDILAKVSEQVGEGDSSRMPASVVPDPQSGAVLSQDKSSPSEEVPIAKPENSADSTTLTTAPEVLAKATPSVGGEEGPPVLAEHKAVSPAVARQEKIADLLSLGHESLKRDRLLFPSHDSAYKYYQQTLILDPGNDDALFGIERIVARYIVLARKALERQDKKKSGRYIDRGLSINPTDKRLLALQDSLSTPVAVVEEPVLQPQPPVIQAEEQVPVVEVKPEPAPENFLSRLKAFFTKGQSAARPNEVVVEER